MRALTTGNSAPRCIAGEVRQRADVSHVLPRADGGNELPSDEQLPLNPLAGFVFQQLISYDRLGEGSG